MSTGSGGEAADEVKICFGYVTCALKSSKDIEFRGNHASTALRARLSLSRGLPGFHGSIIGDPTHYESTEESTMVSNRDNVL